MCAKNDRISAARACLNSSDCRALIILGMPNIRYLTGFTGSDGAVIITERDNWFLTDSRYTSQASQEVPCFDIKEYRGKVEGIASLIGAAGITRACFEADQCTVSFHNKLVETLLNVEFVPLADELEHLRSIKDVEEVALLERSAAIASAALLDVVDSLRPGAVEREIALALEIAMKRAGADDKAFDFIVASGPRGALPHGKASDRIISKGDLVTIDYGAIYQGYNSDETVTVAVGRPDIKQQEVYEIVKQAHDRALDAVRPGVALKQLDHIARDYIVERGYGAYFGHGLGHGVGLEVHEKPVVSFRSEGVVEEGMVFTIEPGIYIPGWGGVRIEDTVLVVKDGCRLLTKTSKELIVL